VPSKIEESSLGKGRRLGEEGTEREKVEVLACACFLFSFLLEDAFQPVALSIASFCEQRKLSHKMLSVVFTHKASHAPFLLRRKR